MSDWWLTFLVTFFALSVLFAGAVRFVLVRLPERAGPSRAPAEVLPPGSDSEALAAALDRILDRRGPDR